MLCKAQRTQTCIKKVSHFPMSPVLWTKTLQTLSGNLMFPVCKMWFVSGTLVLTTTVLTFSYHSLSAKTIASTTVAELEWQRDKLVNIKYSTQGILGEICHKTRHCHAGAKRLRGPSSGSHCPHSAWIPSSLESPCSYTRYWGQLQFFLPFVRK